jgi:hypothetical protein
MTTINDLVERNQWQDVSPALLRLYPDQRSILDRYQLIWHELQELTPSPTSMRLVLEECFDDVAREAYVDVQGRNGKRNKDACPEIKGDMEWEAQEAAWGLAFQPWEEWLSMEVDADTLTTYSEVKILAHCLWEMTWNGFTQEAIQNHREELRAQS